MEKQQSAAAARPHWRRREPSDGEVYVVHPTHFRTVVQQLTGAPPPVANNNANVAAQHNNRPSQQHMSSNNNNNGSVTTLGQMHQECMAWAAQDDQH
ncbi:Os10g0101800 [Oryza sativa Japonica Group]|jgi:hypothetical protein|uniref:VQ domain-containing protein n=5 Tax=Oryza TaxID=4527 RepID=A0A8J8XG34_ORYSJ|nr:Hypothetical protein [Oryza sativa Japonica Group]EAY77452.1 hypothetical protein OsI_32496 [Oryza sativa Indica Group]AAP51756.1 VQ motif family protein [Oryza sativa Japonica Group]EAZ15045.1 hypothetical protein OsJ_30453 [Oryza sativa Japonica Group]KAF2912335.1 hypothetical protein DAI22_10g001100 [Oryza sativa Japonica Group]